MSENKMMKTARLYEPCRIVMEEERIPEIRETQVLLKILCFGVCGSDMQIYHGKHKAVTMPVVMGHEMAALVVKTGDYVRQFQEGDKVTVEPQIMCGSCYPCQTGRFNVCENLKVMGVHVDGCNCEYYAVEEKYLHHIPSDMEPEKAALAEPLAVAVGCVGRSRRIQGGNVLVVGAGTIGNLVIQAAKAAGAKRILAADRNDERLQYAKICGADDTANTETVDLKTAVEVCFGVRKADVIIDCAAVPAVFKQILHAARPDSDIILTGNYKEPVDFEIPLIQRREINLLGHMMYVREDFETAIRLLYEGKIEISQTVSQRYPFSQYAKALKFADQNPEKVMKMMIYMDGQMER